MKILVPVTLVLAIIAVILAGTDLALTMQRSTKAQLAHVQSRISDLQTSLNQVQFQAGQMDTTQLNNQIRALNSCLPQMYAYVTDASISGSYLEYPNGNNTVNLLEYPASINWGPQLSLDCQRLLSPSH